MLQLSQRADLKIEIQDDLKQDRALLVASPGANYGSVPFKFHRELTRETICAWAACQQKTSAFGIQNCPIRAKSFIPHPSMQSGTHSRGVLGMTLAGKG
jgi:hypothetical protein